MKNEIYYIVRADRAGVFFGKIKEKKENSVVMTDVRKIFYWDGAAAVEQISQDGVNNQSKLTVPVSEMEIDKWIQVIPCTEKATKILTELPSWRK